MDFISKASGGKFSTKHLLIVVAVLVVLWFMGSPRSSNNQAHVDYDPNARSQSPTSEVSSGGGTVEQATPVRSENCGRNCGNNVTYDNTRFTPWDIPSDVGRSPMPYRLSDVYGSFGIDTTAWTREVSTTLVDSVPFNPIMLLSEGKEVPDPNNPEQYRQCWIVNQTTPRTLYLVFSHRAGVPDPDTYHQLAGTDWSLPATVSTYKTGTVTNDVVSGIRIYSFNIGTPNIVTSCVITYSTDTVIWGITLEHWQ